MEAGQEWKKIWEKRADKFENIDFEDVNAVFLELKRIDGFDVVGDGIPLEALLKQHESIVNRLKNDRNFHSVFEVGCGCGANLYLFMKAGYEIGGIDYSKTQISIAKRVFNNNSSVVELICDEALKIVTNPQYDVVFSNGVFSYFPNYEYAECVLDKMLQKTKKSIGIIDVLDMCKQSEFEEYRRKIIEDYDIRYKNLKKWFYDRHFFEQWAKRNNCYIEFYESDVDGYWNNQYAYDVYIYKN